MDKCIVIAEIGSSPAPEWDFDRWLDEVVYTGAQAVKVQMFRADHFPASERTAKRALEFPRQRWGEFVYEAHKRGLRAGASVFDEDALRQVLEYGDFIKIAAREQENADLLTTIAMSHHSAPRQIPIYRSVSDLRILENGFPFDIGDVILLTIPHYPTSLSTALVKVCQAALAFDDRAWGWSSHTPNMLDCWLAAKLGASLIEKHLVIESTDLDAQHSLLPHDFRTMVERVR